MLLRPRHEDQTERQRADRLGHPSDELGRSGVLEGDRERPPEDDGDRAGSAAAQAAGSRVRSAVAELRRRVQDALAQGGGEALGPIEGIGHRAGGHAGRPRNGHDPGPGAVRACSGVAWKGHPPSAF